MNEEDNIEPVKKETNLDRVAAGLGVDAVDAAFLWNTQLSTRKKRMDAARRLDMLVSPCVFCKRFHDVETNEEIETECPHWKLPLNDCRRSILDWLEEEA